MSTIPIRHPGETAVTLWQEVRALREELRNEKAARVQIEHEMGRMWRAVHKAESRKHRPANSAPMRRECFICGSFSRCRHREPDVELAELSLAAVLRERSEP